MLCVVAVEEVRARDHRSDHNGLVLTTRPRGTCPSLLPDAAAGTNPNMWGRRPRFFPQVVPSPGGQPVDAVLLLDNPQILTM